MAVDRLRVNWSTPQKSTYPVGFFVYFFMYNPVQILVRDLHGWT